MYALKINARKCTEVILAEARRRKWLEDNPEASSNDEPVVFDTSIIPWWAWIKRFHLPEAERLNGRLLFSSHVFSAVRKKQKV